MNALITGIAAFFVAALGAVCPDEYVYVPALLSVIVVGGYVGRALKRLGRVAEAIEVLRDGLERRGAADERFRRAVVLWNLACYRALVSKDIESVIQPLTEALHHAPEFRADLTTENLDRDLVPLLGNPIFDRWRGSVLNQKR